MPDFSSNFYGTYVKVRARNAALPTTEANLNIFNTNALKWASVFCLIHKL